MTHISWNFSSSLCQLTNCVRLWSQAPTNRVESTPMSEIKDWSHFNQVCLSAVLGFCGGLDGNGSNRLICLNTGSPVWGIVCLRKIRRCGLVEVGVTDGMLFPMCSASCLLFEIWPPYYYWDVNPQPLLLLCLYPVSIDSNPLKI